MGRLRACLAGSLLLTVLEAVAFPVHLEDVDVMGEPVQQGACQPFGSERFGPFVERQVAGDQRGAALVAAAENLEQ